MHAYTMVERSALETVLWSLISLLIVLLLVVTLERYAPPRTVSPPATTTPVTAVEPRP